MGKKTMYSTILSIGGKVDKSLGKATKTAGNLMKGLAKVGKAAAAGATAVTAAAAAVATKSLETYEDFQQAMANSAAIAGATGEDYERLEAAAREMGAKTTKSATEAAEALGYMALAGWDADTSIAGLEPVLRLSEATQMDLARCSDLVTDSMSAMGIGVDELEGYLNLAVQTNNKANTTAEALMEAFIGCGGAAKGVGVETNELATALGILANNGTKGAEAGTAMNAMLVRMTSKDTAINAMKKLGVSAFDAAGNFRGMEAVLTDLSSAMDGLNTEEQAKAMADIAGTNYYTEMSYLMDAMKTGADGAASAWATLEGQLGEANAGDGALMTMAGKITNTLQGSKAILESAVQEAQLTIGEQLAPYAQEAFTYLANDVLPQVTEKLKTITERAVEFGKKAGPKIAEIGQKYLPMVRDAIGWIGNGAKRLWDMARPLLERAGAWIDQLIPPLLNVARDIFPLLISVVQPIAAVLMKLGDMILPPIAALLEKLSTMFQALAPAAQWLADVIGQGLCDAYEAYQPLIDGLLQEFGGLIDFITGVFTGNWELAWEGVKNIFKGVFNSLAGYACGPINAIIRYINKVIEGLNTLQIDIPDWVPGLGGKSFGIDIPQIQEIPVPQLADGGIATAPTFAQIGEGGEPEAVLPLSKLNGLLEKVQKSPGPGGHGGDGVTFAPVFQFYGSVSKKEAEEAGRVSFAEFKRLYRKMQEEDRRKRFAT